MKKLYSLLLLLAVSVTAMAQYTVTGNVKRTNNNPVANHKVYIANDSNGTSATFQTITATTNSSGNFTATVPLNAASIIVYTYDCANRLQINRHNYNASGVTSNFTICVTPPPPPSNTMRGSVFIGTSRLMGGIQQAVVYRIKKCTAPATGTTLTLIDTVLTDSFGMYYFNSVPTVGTGCQLLVKAALTTNAAQYNNYLPGYWVNNTSTSLLWSGATAVTPNNLAGNIDIHLSGGTNTGGPGFIGGSVLQGANKTTAVGDPLKSRIIMLTDNNDNAIAYAYSDAQGKFSFSNLPYGTYKLHGDAWAKTNPALTVTVDASNSKVENIIFRENSSTFKGELTTSVSNVAGQLGSISVFPNPVADVINIQGLNNISGEKHVRIMNIAGVQVYNNTFAQGAQVAIPASSFTPGIYMLQVDTEAGKAVFKVVK